MSRIAHINLDDTLELFLRRGRTTDEDCRKAFKVALYYQSIECIRLLLKSGRLKKELIVESLERIRKEPSVIIYNDFTEYFSR